MEIVPGRLAEKPHVTLIAGPAPVAPHQRKKGSAFTSSDLRKLVVITAPQKKLQEQEPPSLENR
jgi:hypothetical protein